jgi:SAM-dependent methyltransferase
VDRLRLPLAADHVLGVGAASLTLAQATPRTPVGRALDIGTGCGVQALHLAGHAEQVTATDVSPRALRMAATSAALSGQAWDLRRGSLLEPVAGERFDLVVANPPFVVSSGADGYDYRDSGLAGDGVSEALVRQLPAVLAPGGTAQLLANWVITGDQTWDERLHGWLVGSGCDAWVWQREVAEPGEYVSLWLRDAGERPGTPTWNLRYDAWLDWFDQAGVAAVGMGLVTMWRSESADPAVVCEDVPQAVEQPVGALLPGWIARRRWLQHRTDADLLASSLRAADDLVLDRSAVVTSTGWQDATAQLRQASGLRWSLEVDEAVAAVVAGCDGTRPLSGLVAVLSAALQRPAGELAPAVLPVVRDLVGRGFLLPEDGS